MTRLVGFRGIRGGGTGFHRLLHVRRAHKVETRRRRMQAADSLRFGLVACNLSRILPIDV